MRFVTITARFDGTCRRCGERFEAGTRVRYNGRGCWHLKADCPAAVAAPTGDPRAEFGYDGRNAMYGTGHEEA